MKGCQKVTQFFLTSNIKRLLLHITVYWRFFSPLSFVDYYYFVDDTPWAFLSSQIKIWSHARKCVIPNLSLVSIIFFLYYYSQISFPKGLFTHSLIHSSIWVLLYIENFQNANENRKQFYHQISPLEIRNKRTDLRDATQDTELMKYGHFLRWEDEKIPVSIWVTE